MTESKKGSWVVKIQCTVDKEVICDGCTEDEARQMPWSFAEDERELEMTDWEVKSVEANV